MMALVHIRIPTCNGEQTNQLVVCISLLLYSITVRFPSGLTGMGCMIGVLQPEEADIQLREGGLEVGSG
eukprot:1195718-Prorocentrum_minimum.AAC.12